MSENNHFIAVSGGFSPPHEGHMEYLSDAAAFGNVIVLLNSDEWLMRKTGSVFMKWESRRRVLECLRFVHCVLPAMDDDGTVCRSLDNLKDIISYFGKGGDRTSSNTPEAEFCEKYEIPVIYGLGGKKIQSSSQLVANAQKG